MFETSLVELDKKRNSKGVRWTVLATAIGAQVLGLTGLLAAQYWSVPAVEEPPINAVFRMAPPLPALSSPPAAAQPPAAAAAPPAARATAVPPRLPEAVHQPQTIPQRLPEIRAEDPAPRGDNVANVQEGPPRGSGDGVQDGVGDGMPNGVANDAPLHVGGAVSRPEKLSGPAPIYTETARKVRLQGVVVIEAVIDAQGNVVDAHLIKGLQMGLEAAALDAVRQWKFKPATLAGRPVKVVYTLTVNFQVQ